MSILTKIVNGKLHRTHTFYVYTARRFVITMNNNQYNKAYRQHQQLIIKLNLLFPTIKIENQKQEIHDVELYSNFYSS